MTLRDVQMTCFRGMQQCYINTPRLCPPSVSAEIFPVPSQQYFSSGVREERNYQPLADTMMHVFSSNTFYSPSTASSLLFTNSPGPEAFPQQTSTAQTFSFHQNKTRQWYPKNVRNSPCSTTSKTTLPPRPPPA